MRTGDQVIALAHEASNELLLVAPFMREAAVRRILSACADSVAVTCITRWNPVEILQRVSDLEVWNVIKSRPHSKMLLSSRLHAKLFRSEKQCLIGSANLTLKGLGWATDSNIELLVNIPIQGESLAEFERILLRHAVEATEEIRDEVALAVEALRGLVDGSASADADSVGIEVADSFASDRESAAQPVTLWCPTCSVPERLYDAYCGNSTTMSGNNFRDACRDIKSMEITQGLSPEGFMSNLRAAFMMMPIVSRFEAYLTGHSRNWNEINAWCRAQCTIEACDGLGESSWQALREWLIFLLGTRYQRLNTPGGEEWLLAHDI